MYKVVVLPGDGIGPEVTNVAVKILKVLIEKFSLDIELIFAEAGENCIKKYGTNLPKETIKILKKSNACLKGPMTTLEDVGAPISVAVQIRKMFDLYANVRFFKSLPNVPSLKQNLDFVIVRENTEDLYYGKERKIKGGAIAYRLITRKACRRIAEYAFRLALQRRKFLAYVHKANILRLTDGIFKDEVLKVSKKFKEVKVEDFHIDNMAMQLIKRPEYFDVILTTNMFGDILTDEASQIVGGLGLVASMNVGKKYVMFEPAHGSVPKYANLNKANPLAMIFCVKMLLEYFNYNMEARTLENAIIKTLELNIKTQDIGGNNTTTEVGEKIIEILK